MEERRAGWMDGKEDTEEQNRWYKGQRDAWKAG